MSTKIDAFEQKYFSQFFRYTHEPESGKERVLREHLITRFL